MTDDDAQYYEEREIYREPSGGDTNVWKYVAVIFAVCMVLFAALWLYYPSSGIPWGSGGGGEAFDEVKLVNKSAKFNVSFERSVAPYWYLATGFNSSVVQYVSYNITNVTEPEPNHYQNWTFRGAGVGETIITFVLPTDSQSIGGTTEYYRIKVVVS